MSPGARRRRSSRLPHPRRENARPSTGMPEGRAEAGWRIIAAGPHRACLGSSGGPAGIGKADARPTAWRAFVLGRTPIRGRPAVQGRRPRRSPCRPDNRVGRGASPAAAHPDLAGAGTNARADTGQLRTVITVDEVARRTVRLLSARPPGRGEMARLAWVDSARPSSNIRRARMPLLKVLEEPPARFPVSRGQPCARPAGCPTIRFPRCRRLSAAARSTRRDGRGKRRGGAALGDHRRGRRLRQGRRGAADGQRRGARHRALWAGPQLALRDKVIDSARPPFPRPANPRALHALGGRASSAGGWATCSRSSSKRRANWPLRRGSTARSETRAVSPNGAQAWERLNPIGT